MCGGEFAFKNRLCWLIVGRKFTIFSLSYFEFESTVFKYKPSGGAYIRRGHLTEGFALPVLRAYVWRGLFSEFYSIFSNSSRSIQVSRLKYPICKKLLV